MYEKIIKSLSSFVTDLLYTPQDKEIIALNKKGCDLCVEKKYAEAIQYYDQALALDTRLIVVWFNKGNALKDQEKYAEAIECYDQALGLDEKRVYVWNEKGNVLLEQEKYAEAIQCYDQILVLDKKCVYAWNNKGSALLNQGKYMEAIACYDQALVLDKKYIEAWNGKGVVSLSQGKYIEAIVCYDQMLAIDTKSVNGWNGKGVALLGQGKYTEAIGCYDQTLTLDKKYVRAWQNKVLVSLLQHDLKHAEEYLNESAFCGNNHTFQSVLTELYDFARQNHCRLFEVLDKHFTQFQRTQAIRSQLNIYFWAGKFFVEYGALDEAEICLQKGLILQKDNLQLRQLETTFLQACRDKLKSLSIGPTQTKPTSSIQPVLFSDQAVTTITIFQQIPWNHITLRRFIGSGSYGDVYEGSWHAVTVAIKQLHLKTLSTSLLEDFAQETKIMAQCQFPHIVQLHGVCTEEGHMAMVMEYMPKGSLYHVLHDEKETLAWNPIRWNIAIDIGKGLTYLHDQKIIHRDLKSLNVLLDNQYHAKIGDFGLSKIKLESASTSSKMRKGMGTTRWRAPELFKRKAVPNEASDNYSYGMILWEIASRQTPFVDAHDDVMATVWIQQGQKEEIPQDCPKAYGEVIQACWDLPDKRPSAQTIVSILNQAQLSQTTQVSKFSEGRFWHFDPETKAQHVAGEDVYKLVDATDKDKHKVIQFYQHHPVPGYEMASVQVIYNPSMNYKFALHLAELQQCDNNPALKPKWPMGQESNKDPVENQDKINWRNEVHQQFKNLTKPYQDNDYPAVNLLPMWHGTKREVVDSICRTGYANLATTDSGFFGKGIYGAYEAEYSYRVYAKQDGALILNWTASFSAYPVIDGDMSKFVMRNSQGQEVSIGNYSNYDAHFVPVVPADPTNPNEKNYYPTKPHQRHTYTELVVFQKAACLPRYLVQLQPTLPKTVPSSTGGYGKVFFPAATTASNTLTATATATTSMTTTTITTITTNTAGATMPQYNNS